MQYIIGNVMFNFLQRLRFATFRRDSQFFLLLTVLGHCLLVFYALFIANQLKFLKKSNRIFGISLLFLSALTWASAQYPFTHPAQQAQFQALLHDLRCPVCQNQDLADSNAALAGDLRDEVYHLVLTQHSDQEIIDFLTQRYGHFIVFNPPMTMLTAVLWYGPLCLLCIGLGLFALCGIRRGRQ